MDPGALSRRSRKDAATNAAAQAEFNEKKRVWIPDDTEGFLAAWIKKGGNDNDQDSTAEVVVATSGETRTVPTYALSPMNPPQFDGVEDIADLTHLNEASVINNLRLRYGAGDIYTYSGLFLISLNPYRNLPIYTSRVVAQYRTKRREENPPHIYAVAERAWQQIGEERESQSILITGESGAGKTENTKKVIQYLAAIASAVVPSEAESSTTGLERAKSLSQAPALGLPRSSSYKGKEAEEIDLASIASSTGPVPLGLLEQQILQANPILEAFGNAQTMRNNNSSRFGKFIRIFFSHSGAIAGANIDWYLLEKSRVTARAEGERGFHVFYQLLRGAKDAGYDKSLLLDHRPDHFDFLKKTRLQIDGVDDLAEWKLLRDALRVVGFSEQEQLQLFRIPAIILHIGNIALTGTGSDQALIPPESQGAVDKVCHLLGIDVTEFSKTVLRPKVRAGREWVTQARSKKQAEDELAALCKFMYEKNFGWMVDRINTALDRPSAKSLSIGVLDIAGFEIFVENSYEQLLINFTNEKLQQFFNFHMFTLEQEEYAREGIEWDYVNFGLDLQPTIELIESTQPVGILSVLDEECIMPKASDTTFTDKVHQYWETPRGGSPAHPGSAKFKSTRFSKGFVVKHYAGDVEYSTTGWLEKNKDPINEPLAKLLAQSDKPEIAALFTEYAEDAAASTGVHKKVKRGAFRTVGQRHKEQLGQLMTQLSATQPHFVRCIVPNSDKKPGRVEVNLVLDQLRCNGVLEGIRIARLGYPNRHSFSEFRQRYEVLTPGVIPAGYMDGRKAAERIAEALDLDKEFYKIGATKIFFKAGILAELEERRDNLLTDLFRRFQSAARMSVSRRRFKKLLNRSQAIQRIQHNARIYLQLRDWPWWSLYVKVRPLLAATKTDSELVKKQAELQMAKERAERDQQEKRKLEDLKASLLAEKTKVELDLSSERQLAHDRDLMLQRSKATEAELLEKIAALEDDLAELDGEREEAVTNADAAKLALSKVQNEMDQLVRQAALLEKEASAWRKREAELLKDSKDRSSAHSKLETERGEMSRLVDNLKREVSQKEDAMKRLKERGELNTAELEKRLQLEKGKATSNNTQISDLSTDLRQARLQQDELKEVIKRHEATVAAKQRDIANLESQQTAAAKAQTASEQEKSALGYKIEALNQELSTRNTEKQKVVAERTKLEKELDDLRKVMAAKSSEDIKRQEADKSREAEMSRLRDQVASTQSELDAQRKKEQQLSAKVREEVEGLRQRHVATDKELKSARSNLKDKETQLSKLQQTVTVAENARRQVEAELATVRDKLASTETKLQTTSKARDDLEGNLAKAQEDYIALEDAVLEIENEKADWASRMETVSRQLTNESAKRQHFEQLVYDNQVELAELRNASAEAERELAKAAGEIKTRDDEIALLRSRENKTVIEHVYVLENAKKIAERETANQIAENTRLNKILKSLEATKYRLQSELDDAKKQVTEMKSTRSKQARAARASLSTEDKDTAHLLEDETKARQVAEARAAGLDRDLQELRKKMSTAHLSPNRPSAAEMKYARMEDEINRFHQEHEALLMRNKQLEGELTELRHRSGAPATPTHHSSRADLLRGLQQSHDALGRDMSDQLRRLETPLTPSRKQSTLRNGDQNHDPAATDLQTSKRLRALQQEVDELQQQLEVEKTERNGAYTQMRQWQTGAKLPYDVAGYSQVKSEVRSLRSKLDGWLDHGDVNDVAGLRRLLEQFEADGQR